MLDEKPSTEIPWKGGTPWDPNNSDSWKTVAPSSEGYNLNWPEPKELDFEGIRIYQELLCEISKKVNRNRF